MGNACMSTMIRAVRRRFGYTQRKWKPEGPPSSTDADDLAVDLDEEEDVEELDEADEEPVDTTGVDDDDNTLVLPVLTDASPTLTVEV